MSCVGRPSIVPVAFALLVASVSVPAAAADSKSTAIAKELVQALDAAKLGAIATADPSNPGVFIAALYIPETQLLVVSAKYSAPPLLVDRINAKDYQAVYVDLQSASVRGSKIFVMDQGADGLLPKLSGDSSAPDWAMAFCSPSTLRRKPNSNRFNPSATIDCSRASSRTS